MSPGSGRILGETAAEQNYWLTHGMAKTLGLSISREIAAGRLDRRDLAAMIVRCGSCQFQERCFRWMGEGGGPGAPAFCLNHGAFAALTADRDRGGALRAGS